jgi:SAM-dependent methyltransferase
LVGLTRESAVLDLGTGTGNIAIELARYVAAVTAMDPSPEMLATAEQNARIVGVSPRFVQGSSEDLGSHLGRYRLVAIGRAFHYMDRTATLKALDALVEPGGAVALLGTRYLEVPANAWHRDFRALKKQYKTEEEGGKIRVEPVCDEAILLASPFQHLERSSVIEQRETPIEGFVHRALSYASVWEGRPGSRQDDLAVDVRKVMRGHAGGAETVQEVVEGHALVAFRRGELSGG